MEENALKEIIPKAWATATEKKLLHKNKHQDHESKPHKIIKS
jgi:hypothetical protein